MFYQDEDSNVDDAETDAGSEVEQDDKSVEQNDGDQDNEEPDDEEGEDKEKEIEEEEEKDPEVFLSSDMIPGCLSLLCKTGDGLAHAYVRLDATDKELTDIKILSSYIHLRYVDLSKNNLQDINSLSSLTHLLTIKVDFNKLTSAKLDELPYLQSASFTNNRIRTLEGVGHPMLEQLNLSANNISVISGLEPGHLTRLHTLHLRANSLTSLIGLDLPNLKILDLEANQIRSLEGLKKLRSLAELLLSENLLETLDGTEDGPKHLSFVDLRSNNLSDLLELKHLAKLPSLNVLTLAENPFSEQEDYRMEALVVITTLDKLDEDEYNEDEKLEAEKIREDRHAEEEQLQQQQDQDQLNMDAEDNEIEAEQRSEHELDAEPDETFE